ncbi:hypothetical protein P154DRAFT_611337 [Amniculicola lignicola CBS 123094]|uniref:Uncharacterized protein n=1 Tax=Amniculicola lignicola CBS 123094 TaxID=1392246 RepID=A0A6A5W2R1_9PLEO|nr:hypothetical protein P154DRAFT_611337 [Amniculicola lignicola CBS 123094]
MAKNIQQYVQHDHNIQGPCSSPTHSPPDSARSFTARPGPVQSHFSWSSDITSPSHSSIPNTSMSETCCPTILIGGFACVPKAKRSSLSAYIPGPDAAIPLYQQQVATPAWPARGLISTPLHLRALGPGLTHEGTIRIVERTFGIRVPHSDLFAKGGVCETSEAQLIKRKECSIKLHLWRKECKEELNANCDDMEWLEQDLGSMLSVWQDAYKVLWMLYSVQVPLDAFATSFEIVMKENRSWMGECLHDHNPGAPKLPEGGSLVLPHLEQRGDAREGGERLHISAGSMLSSGEDASGVSLTHSDFLDFSKLDFVKQEIKEPNKMTLLRPTTIFRDYDRIEEEESLALIEFRKRMANYEQTTSQGTDRQQDGRSSVGELHIGYNVATPQTSLRNCSPPISSCNHDNDVGLYEERPQRPAHTASPESVVVRKERPAQKQYAHTQGATTSPENALELSATRPQKPRLRLVIPATESIEYDSSMYELPEHKKHPEEDSSPLITSHQMRRPAVADLRARFAADHQSAVDTTSQVEPNVKDTMSPIQASRVPKKPFRLHFATRWLDRFFRRQ